MVCEELFFCVKFYRVWRCTYSGVCLAASAISLGHLTASLTWGLDFLLDNTPQRENGFVSDSSNERDSCTLLSLRAWPQFKSFPEQLDPERLRSGSLLRQIPARTVSYSLHSEASQLRGASPYSTGPGSAWWDQQPQRGELTWLFTALAHRPQMDSSPSTMCP